MAPVVLSTNSGPLAPVAGQDRLSGIDKRPVERLEVRDPGPQHGGLGSGVVGDAIGFPLHHGGSAKAVYAFSREELDWWEPTLERALADGGFGENLTTLGFDLDASRMGDRWHIGTAELEVSGPRIPCATFGLHVGRRGWVKQFAAHGRTGAYLSVVRPGVIEPGQPVEIERADHDYTLMDLFRAATGERSLGRAILDAGVLSPLREEWLAAKV